MEIKITHNPDLAYQGEDHILVFIPGRMTASLSDFDYESSDKSTACILLLSLEQAGAITLDCPESIRTAYQKYLYAPQIVSRTGEDNPPAIPAGNSPGESNVYG